MSKYDKIKPIICDRCKQVVIGQPTRAFSHPRLDRRPLLTLCRDCRDALAAFMGIDLAERADVISCSTYHE